MEEVRDLFRVDERFRDLDDILLLPLSGRINRDDWDDAMLCGKRGVRVYTMCDAEVVELGSIVLKDVMQSVVTEENVGAIILLAWNLRNPEDLTLPIFPNQSPCASSEDVDFHALEKQPFYPTPTRAITTVNNNLISFPISASRAAASIAYVCASLLRLFTKPKENYLNALHYIKSNLFSQFYHSEFPLPWYNPPNTSLEAISIHLRRNPVFKYGMAGMLYLHNEIGVAFELRKKLYEEHLSCAGLHACKLFSGIQLALQVPAQTLIELLPLRGRRTGELRTLSKITREYDGDDVAENVKRRTWKYARIFNESMFGELQTKSCTELVCILAYLSCLAGVQDEQNIFRIAELQKVAEPFKETCRKIAQKVFDAVSAIKAERNTALV